MKIQFGDIEIKIPYEKYFGKNNGMVNPFETMFLKSNQAFLNEFFKNPSNFTNIYGEFVKWMENYAKMSKLGKSNN